jgi:YD repeat-containing protein
VLVQPKTCYVFDPLSRPTKVTDPLGRTTEFAYTLLGKPYRILHPDGSEEHYFYDLQGRLVEEIDKGGAKTVYERDFLGRITRKQIFSPIGELLVETTAGYDTFHLLWETDPEGVITTFTYDAAGRKISESKGDITTTFVYDSAGRLASKQTGDSILKFAYDRLGRIIEETSQAYGGPMLTQKNYVYEQGRIVLTSYPTAEGIASIRVLYDTHGIPIEVEKPGGALTRQKLLLSYINEWGQRVTAIETSDPLGNKTLLVNDTQGRTVYHL